MRDQKSPFCLEIRTPKGRFELDAPQDSSISELRVRIAKELQAEPPNVRLISGGKIAPEEGALADFLTPSPSLSAGQPAMGLNNFTIYAICHKSPIKPPETPEAVQKLAEAREAVLDLMPSHIREDLDSGSTRFIDMVDSWVNRMYQNPENTRRQLQSPETRSLLACMRVFKRPAPPAASTSGRQMPPIGLINTDALMGTPQNTRFMQELLDQQQKQLNSSNQLTGIHQDIKFYQRMVQESMRMPQPPQPQPPPPPPPPPPRSSPMQSNSTAPVTPATEEPQSAKMDIGDSLPLPDAQHPHTEAFKQALDSLRRLRQEAPELLPKLMQEAGLDDLAAASSNQQQMQQMQQMQSELRQQMESEGNPLAGLAQLSGLFEQFVGSLGGGDACSDHSHLVPQLREMGFEDDEASLIALQQTGGDLNAAVDLLSQK